MKQYTVEQYINHHKIAEANNCKYYAMQEIVESIYEGVVRRVSSNEYITTEYDLLNPEENGIIMSPQISKYKLYHENAIEYIRTHPFYEIDNDSIVIQKPYSHVNEGRNGVLIWRKNEETFFDINGKRLAISFSFEGINDEYYDIEKAVDFLSKRNDIKFLDNNAPKRAQINNHIYKLRYDDELYVVPVLWTPTQEEFDKMLDFFDNKEYIDIHKLFNNFIGIGKFIAHKYRLEVENY